MAVDLRLNVLKTQNFSDIVTVDIPGYSRTIPDVKSIVIRFIHSYEKLILFDDEILDSKKLIMTERESIEGYPLFETNDNFPSDKGYNVLIDTENIIMGFNEELNKPQQEKSILRRISSSIKCYQQLQQ